MSVILIIYELKHGKSNRNLIAPVMLEPDPHQTDFAKAYAAMVKAGVELEELENAHKPTRTPRRAH